MGWFADDSTLYLHSPFWSELSCDREDRAILRVMVRSSRTVETVEADVELIAEVLHDPAIQRLMGKTGAGLIGVRRKKRR